MYSNSTFIFFIRFIISDVISLVSYTMSLSICIVFLRIFTSFVLSDIYFTILYFWSIFNFFIIFIALSIVLSSTAHELFIPQLFISILLFFSYSFSAVFISICPPYFHILQIHLRIQVIFCSLLLFPFHFPL